jgi:hypothetical protein
MEYCMGRTIRCPYIAWTDKQAMKLVFPLISVICYGNPGWRALDMDGNAKSRSGSLLSYNLLGPMPARDPSTD